MESEAICALPTLEERVCNECGDEPPMLSLHALQALEEFVAEGHCGVPVVTTSAECSDVVLLSEDWRLSQFWYEHDTAKTVANEILRLCQLKSTPVICICCPTIFAYLKQIDSTMIVQLLEYDTRFQKYGHDFVFYDYNMPVELPESLEHSYGIIVADPPYLSKECLEKVSETIKFLSHPGETSLLLLTGEVQKEMAYQLLGLRPHGFKPQHRSKLGNEFRIFTNYNHPQSGLGLWEEEIRPLSRTS